MSEFVSNNPMLLNPNIPLAHNQQVPATPGITKPFPVIIHDTPSYYICSLLNHHMCRTDGKRLAFTHGVLATKDHFDMEYLEGEIGLGNPVLRKASEKEIELYKMKTDPHGTMKDKLTPQIEAEVRVKLEVELREKMEENLKKIGVELTEDQWQVMKASQSVVGDKKVEEVTGLSTVDALQRLKSQFSGSVKSGSGTVHMEATPTGGNSSLGGISGSDKTTNFAPKIDDTLDSI